MEKRERQFIPGLSVLLLSVVVFGLIGSLLHDYKGVPYGAVGGVIWAGALLLTFLLGTAFISRRLLPVQGNPGWSEGFRLLWRNYMMGAAQILAGRQREVVTTTIKKKKSAAPVQSPSFELIGAGFLFSHEAAAITRGNSYQRADGPGLVLLQPGEMITQVFDLRTQSRRMSVGAITRDGIPVETSVSVSFHVRRLKPGERRPRSVEADNIPFRYDRDAIFDLNYASAVSGVEERLGWTEQVCPQAATLLVSEIGKYTLDQLLDSAGAEPMGKIKANILNGLQAQQKDDEGQLLPKGIEIVGVGVGGLELPDDVHKKRLTTWQVEWQNKIETELVGAEVEMMRQHNQARARAQVESIEKLLQSIEIMRQQSQTETYEAVMARLYELMEVMLANDALRRMASRTHLLTQASEASSQLHQILEREG